MPTHAPAADAGLDSAPIRVTVTGRDLLSATVIGLQLTPADGGGLPDWAPGAHVDVRVGDGSWRQYSLFGTPGSGHYDIAVLLEEGGRGGSAWLHKTAYPGTQLEIRGPRNNFALTDAQRYIFIAGGIGITPILPMLTDAERRGVPWTLHYGGRSAATMAFASELRETYPDKVVLWPLDDIGLIDLERAFADGNSASRAYCCGPEGLLNAARERAVSWPGRLHFERFSAASNTAHRANDRPVRVELCRSGRVIDVPADISILQMLRNAGVTALSSCEEGICGSCEVHVLGGRPDHRDSVLSDEERGSGEYMMVCVSRALDDSLQLDL